MSSHDDNLDDAVGYKKPPKKHQFKKGTSGNPSGGRRKPATKTGRRQTNSGRHSLKKLAQKMITIVEGGRRKRVTTQEAVQHLLIRDACQGDKRSILAAIKLFERLENEERDEHRALFRAALEFKEAAARDGRDSSSVPPVYPDHRDIEIDRLNGSVEFTGPMDAEHALVFDGMAAHRDQLIEEYEEDVKLLKESPDENGASELSRLLTVIERWNALLPKRLRRTPPSIEAEAVEQDPTERLVALLEKLQASNRSATRRKRKQKK